MKNAMQLKAIIKNLAKEKHISAQLVMQNFMLERLLERISISKYQQNFILKGGFLIAAMVGLDTRATMDMDATIKGLPVNEQTVREMFEEICKIELEDDVTFSFRSIEEIREGDVYTGYRVSLSANYPPMAVPLKLDITTGDKITPSAIAYEYPFVFDEGSATVMAYPLETVLAEKIETVLARNVATTRIRDFYDIYELWRVRGHAVHTRTLAQALAATCEKRNSWEAVERREEIIDAMRADDGLRRQWQTYASKHSYAAGLSFAETLDSVRDVIESIAPFL